MPSPPYRPRSRSRTSSPFADAVPSGSSFPTYPRNPSSSGDGPAHGSRGLDVDDDAFSDPSASTADSHTKSPNGTAHTGGFLLEDAVTVAPRTSTERRFSPNPKREKGDQVAEEKIDVATSPWSSMSHRKRPSKGKSPLAFEVTNTLGQNGEGEEATSKGTGSPRAPAEHQLKEGAAARANSGRLGTDVTQIINLALSLGENRRRQVSTGALNQVPVTASEVNESAGHVTRPIVPNYGRTGNSSQFTKQRKSSKIHPPHQDAGSARSSWAAPDVLSAQNASTTRSLVVPFWDLDSLKQTKLTPSDSTAARTAKAKEYFELAGQYRELLSHLSPLPPPRGSGPGVTEGSNGLPAQNGRLGGRCYNPLQYIRNRKIRALHECTIDSETDGWKDVAKVRAWVTHTVETRRQAHGMELNDTSLPQLGKSSPRSSSRHHAMADSADHPTKPPAARPFRSRIDWSVMPWDLLADADWIDQNDNKLLIEDRKGRKLYRPSPTSGNKTSDARRPVLGTVRKSLSIERVTDVKAPAPAEGDRQPDDVHTGGRGRRPQAHDPVLSAHERSISRDRKNKWPRTLIRSQSPSSSEESGSASTSSKMRQRLRPQSQERQDGMILEKQIDNILAAENRFASWNGLHKSSSAHPATPNKELPSNPQSVTSLKGKNLAADAKEIDEDYPRAGPHGSPSSRQQVVSRRSQSPAGTEGSTAPNSPDSKFSVPSIAINSSPPKGRKLSKLLANNALHRLTISDRKPNLQHPEKDTELGNDGNVDAPLEGDDGGKEATTFGGFLSPKSAEKHRQLRRRRSDSRSLHSDVEPKESEGKRRAMMRSSRIVDFVSNPVHRVGDLIRRKDTVEAKETLSPATTQLSDTFTDDEDRMEIGSKTESGLGKQRETGIQGEKAESVDKPRYHVSNLPVFKSPFRAKRDQRSISSERRPDGGQRRQSQDSGRFNRFRRFGSLSFDTGSPSPSASSPRQSTKISDDGLDGSYELQNRQQSRRFAVVGGSADGPARDRLIAGTDNPNALPHQLTGGLDPRDLHVWAEIKPLGHTVRVRDIARIQSLVMVASILCSPTTAGSTSGKSVSMSQSPKLEPGNALSLHFDSAMAVADNIGTTNEAIREAANRLTNIEVSGMHAQIRELDSRISSKLTLQVRGLTDDADKLGSRLATSCTLEVKRLNDRIDQIMRRRRRRFRWLRRGGYLLLEWTLLATMWWVWLIVVILRLARGLVQILWHSARWLLWL